METKDFTITNTPNMYFIFNYVNTTKEEESIYYDLEDVIKIWYESCIKGNNNAKKVGKVFTIEALEDNYQLTIIDEYDAAYYIDYGLNKNDEIEIFYWEQSR